MTNDKLIEGKIKSNVKKTNGKTLAEKPPVPPSPLKYIK